jgi:hypothetical protein
MTRTRPILKRTTALPTEPGWYWWRINRANPEISIVLDDLNGGLEADKISLQKFYEVMGCERRFNDVMEWAGPIPQPEEP